MYLKQFLHLNRSYSKHLYTGFLGILFRISHELMEKNYRLFKGEKIKVLEVGGGKNPHIKYLRHLFNEYHSIDIDDNNELEYFYNQEYPLIKFQKYNGKNIPFKDNTFERIIISHCLEHINFPEEFLNELLRVTKKNGIISIALPTDPGIAWRIGRFFIKKFLQKKTHKLSDLDYEYVNAIEHVNSIFNLRTIIRKKFNIFSEIFFPFKIKLVDINLFYIVDIKKI